MVIGLCDIFVSVTKISIRSVAEELCEPLKRWKTLVTYHNFRSRLRLYRTTCIMSAGPLPSEICLLSDLPTRAPGEKVRFLGW
jgi:hypothetical protein